jgi:hypothetical protein
MGVGIGELFLCVLALVIYFTVIRGPKKAK